MTDTVVGQCMHGLLHSCGGFSENNRHRKGDSKKQTRIFGRPKKERTVYTVLCYQQNAASTVERTALQSVSHELVVAGVAYLPNIFNSWQIALISVGSRLFV